MKIIINAGSIYKGGAEQVVNSIINECRHISENEYHIILRDNVMNMLDLGLFNSNFHFYTLDKRPGSSYYNLYKTLQHFNNLEKQIDPDVVISTGGHGYWNPNVPIVTAFNIPHYIYPESPYFKKISAKKKFYWKLKKRFDLSFYKKSSAIIVQTDDVNERVGKLLPEKNVYTVSNTVNGAFTNPKHFKCKLPPKKEGEVRLITVSADYPHKNLEIIKDALNVLLDNGVRNIRFVLTLPEDRFNEKFGDEKYRNHIVNVGPVTIDECPSLYDECDFMFLPTLLECFSASYVEAMAMKKPIITSDLGFAHTICKDAALYFNPLDGIDIADKIIELVNSPTLENKLIDAGSTIYQSINTPRERALSFLKIAESVVEQKLVKA